jgi:signal transduction histidine kinase
LKLKNETGDLPPVFADPKQLRMIVQNLLSNAVKYTPAKGTVAVTLRPADAADLSAAQLTHATRPYWYFSVQDTGYGIPKDQQPKIFGKLFRADNVRALDVEGTGLGLYIVKEVVEAMGGRVWFKSIEGAGTTFYVVAPFPEHKHIK